MSDVQSARWSTAVTRIQQNQIAPRGYPIEELMGNVSFAAAIHLLFVGELPESASEKLLEAVLVASIDHGPSSPSAQTARTIASTGADVQLAATAGLLAMSRYHGPVTDAMEFLHHVVADKQPTETIDQAAQRCVEEWRARGNRVAGFGHRLHSRDPRVARLFALAADIGFESEYILAAQAVERSLNAGLPAGVGERGIPMNLDGAIAAILCAIGLPVQLGNPFFMIARFVGLSAQAFEERTRMRPMRRRPDIVIYDGPALRHLTKEPAP